MEFYSTEDAVKWMADTKRVRELDKEEQRINLTTIEQLLTIGYYRTHSLYKDIL